MFEFLQACAEGLIEVLKALPDFVWSALAASVPVAVGAHFAVRKIAQERRHDAKVAAYTKLYKAADVVAINAPGSIDDKEKDLIAAAAIEEFFDALYDVQLHTSARSRLSIGDLYNAVHVLVNDALDPESETSRLSNRRANMLFKEMSGVVVNIARRDLYGMETWGRVSRVLFASRDAKEMKRVLTRVRDESLKTPLPPD